MNQMVNDADDLRGRAHITEMRAEAIGQTMCELDIVEGKSRVDSIAPHCARRPGKCLGRVDIESYPDVVSERVVVPPHRPHNPYVTDAQRLDVKRVKTLRSEQLG